MPWELRGNCVHKKGEDKAVKCHDSVEEAKAHMKALYASESKEVTDEETKDKAYAYVPYGVFTFKDLDVYMKNAQQADVIRDMTSQLRQLIDNVVYNPEIKNKSSALRSLVDEFANRVDNVETKELGDDLTKEKLDLAAEGELDPKEKRELRQSYEALGVADEAIPDTVKSLDDEILVWKEENGSCKVAFIYSNNYRDDDGEPEIIEEKAHKAYTELVNDSVLPKPEMWHWHLPGTKWGQIDYMLYADGFSVAFGTVQPGKEAEAEALASKENVGVSHGMIKRLLMRDQSDPSHIQFYVSKEISDLPMTKAANKLTGLTVLKGYGAMDMEVKGLTDKHKEYLKSLGYSDEQLSSVESQLTAKKEQAEAEGRESKEQKEQGEGGQEDTQESQSANNAPQTNTQEPVFNKESLMREIAEGIGEVFKPMVDALPNLVTQVQTLTAKVDALENKAAKTIVETTPELSMKALLSASVFGGGDESAKIHGGSSLAKDGPTQKKEQTEAPYGIPLFQSIFAEMEKYNNGVQG